jgi:hypothetical protein
MSVAVELQRISTEEFLYVVRVLRRREAAVEAPRAVHTDAVEQTAEVRLRLVKLLSSRRRGQLSYQLDLLPAANRQNRLKASTLLPLVRRA